MKNLVIILLAFVSFSCSLDDDNSPVENQEYLDELLGRYELKAAYLENPIDLNGDGIEGTNLFQEVEYCDMSKHLESYWATIIDRNIQSLNFDIPYSDHYNNYENYTNCLRHKGVFRELNIDSQNESVKLVPNEYEEDFMLEFQAKLIDFSWENRVIYLTLEKGFYTPEGEWADAILYMEYEWVSDKT